ncbi:MAG: DUF2975 domain-containing protein [Pseudomonadota bacterium]
MTIKLARLVYWAASAWLVALPIGALYSLTDINLLARLAQLNLGLPIQWFTVATWQWYGLWAVSVAYLAVGYAGIYFLRRAFRSFASGQWFDTDNSRSLRLFAIFLVAQGFVKPLHHAASSVVLSWNHPPGQGMLSLSAGSHELVLIVSGLVVWVLADLLLAGIRADSENRQFV